MGGNSKYLSILILSAQLQALEPYKRHYFSFITQNDAYFDSVIDRYYTAGHGFLYVSPEVAIDSNDWLGKLNIGFINGVRSYSLSFSQSIYTPKAKFVSTPPP